jgi:hypothetical protein
MTDKSKRATFLTIKALLQMDNKGERRNALSPGHLVPVIIV